MKLILSSADFSNISSAGKIKKCLDKNLSDYKVLYIPNEKATQEKINSDKYYNRLAEYGFDNKKNIYIFNYLYPNKFKNLDIDIIYVSGGNTFATIEILRRNNFDNEIVKYVQNGVIYIGGSCGAHISTPNIKHVLHWDENAVCTENYDGLNLVDFILVCHYDKTRETLMNNIKQESEFELYTLSDEDVLVVNDKDVEIVN